MLAIDGRLALPFEVPEEDIFENCVIGYSLAH
jgi:hypothetical protein